MTALDPRLNAYRNDLADVRLRGRVSARRYAEGRPARVIAGRAAVRRAPDSGASLDTFYHYGEPILVFEEAGNRAWCQSQDDGYVGYVERQQIELGAAAEPTDFVATMGTYLYEAPDLRTNATDFLPRHSAVVIAETGILTRGTEYARLDTGGFAPRACFSAQPPRSLDIVTAAECYLGSPYLWGGKSFFGIDCSGLVQNAFRDLGISVLRDTDMQRDTIGEAVAIASEGDLRRGDLLYMPGHVVIYAGGGIIVHADGATMMVRRDKLADFLRDRRFDFGIFTVRRHPAAADN
ncbi:MAG: peptidase P60 [Alphaproteobacteria bacterium]|nr:MAG: peptidase P60 [Alphaproteobacteria bacterium]